MTTAYHDASPPPVQTRIAWTRLRDTLRPRTVKGLRVPPAQLRHRVHGLPGYGSFLRAGENISRDVVSLLAQHGHPIEKASRLLDFGCGCGRVLRHLQPLAPGASLYGTDTDARAIAWCLRHLPVANCTANEVLPPTNYPDRHFDVIYAISVFTHLEEDSQFAWLEELQRISRPGGAVLISTHGENTRAILGRVQRANLSSKGFVCVKDQTALHEPMAGPQIFPRSHHTEDYIRRTWSRYFDIVAYAPQSINSHQDAVVLRNTIAS